MAAQEAVVKVAGATDGATAAERVRFLRSNGGDEGKAAEALSSYLRWRRAFPLPLPPGSSSRLDAAGFLGFVQSDALVDDGKMRAGASGDLSAAAAATAAAAAVATTSRESAVATNEASAGAGSETGQTSRETGTETQAAAPPTTTTTTTMHHHHHLCSRIDGTRIVSVFTARIGCCGAGDEERADATLRSDERRQPWSQENS